MVGEGGLTNCSLGRCPADLPGIVTSTIIVTDGSELRKWSWLGASAPSLCLVVQDQLVGGGAELMGAPVGLRGADGACQVAPIVAYTLERVFV